MYKDFPPAIHPKVTRPNCCLTLALYLAAFIVLFWILYVLFVIF
jgi:hypothetical protein